MQGSVTVGNPEAETMRGVAAECVNLVGEQFGKQLDWSIASLGELDEVCAELTADGPLAGQRLELWWQQTRAWPRSRGRCPPSPSIHGSRKRRNLPAAFA
jgi:hypothetical protein